MNRKDFQELASIRLKEARILFDSGCWDGAYYLAGYAAECALKACIARKTERHDFPDKARVIESHTHNIGELIRIAGLKAEIEAAGQAGPEIRANWTIVGKWNERSRYERPSRVDAERLLDALAARRHGVIQWLKRHW